MSKKTKSKPGVISLSQADLAVILAMQEKINNLKINLADAYANLKVEEDKLKNISNSIEKLTNEYVEEAKTIARHKGVNIDNPGEGQWNLDLINGTLTKIA